MLCTTGYHQYTRFMRFLRENKVHDEQSYNTIQSLHEWMPVFGKLREKYKKFCFRDLHPQNRSFYWDKYEYNKQIEVANEKFCKFSNSHTVAYRDWIHSDKG